ncbi:growth arrest and DNA damage-inducible protein GADD45 alpha-like [Gigantopelta aegis]|uniref:growth arrest and DNA damage-inducible protein GADD45 alpha-like n=1 Tax=Gigantopelta aegis TaxID=1735272 RepID=UPI001B88C0AF|nr:growth arrest and DNA damage-inducible protein GADD45 alpha-like [Gigantopelta aegis]
MSPHICDELNSVQDTLFKIPTTEAKPATETLHEKSQNTIGHTLLKVLRQAVSSARVTCGIFESTKLLSCSPDSVMLCVLPNAGSSSDVTVHIQHTLMEAFCWENDIKMLKVDESKKLANALGRSWSDDVSCVLLEFPLSGLSPEDERIADFYDTAMYSGISPNPVVELPD